MKKRDPKTNEVSNYENLIAYKMRWGGEVYTSKRSIVSVMVHPKFNGDPNCGYDLSVCILGPEEGKVKDSKIREIFPKEEEIESDLYQVECDVKTLEKHLKNNNSKLDAEITGYPA